MRLLDTSTLKLKEFTNADAPEYAALSHTWGEDEVNYNDMQNIEQIPKSSQGLQKVIKFCEAARSHGCAYAWVDTCCIDKSSSAELTEAINSMYKWYEAAEICIIYLSDVPSEVLIYREDDEPCEVLIYREDDEPCETQILPIRQSRWFERAWTLQELIACSTRLFYDQNWVSIRGTASLTKLCADITGIPRVVLSSSTAVEIVCVATKMSWAARRNACREEDRAYSLMGIFNIHMAILYGEGLDAAFRRLQHEILKTSSDQTLFAWRGDYISSGLLAHRPEDFADTPPLGLWTPKILSPFSMTNIGLCMQASLWLEPSSGIARLVLTCDVKCMEGWKIVMLRLQRLEGICYFVEGQPSQAYRRIDCTTWDALPAYMSKSHPSYVHAVVLEDEHYALLKRAISEDASRKDERSYGREVTTMRLHEPEQPLFPPHKASKFSRQPHKSVFRSNNQNHTVETRVPERVSQGLWGRDKISTSMSKYLSNQLQKASNNEPITYTDQTSTS